MKKILLRLIVGATSLLILVAVLAWFTLRASLPELDGEMTASGLVDTATIERDAAGIPLITARNRRDLALATGFAHGQDRFFQMDLIRRQAAGELSEIVGPATVSVDKRYRFHGFRSKAQAVLAGHTAEQRALLQAYADGVNAGLSSLGTKPFEYYVLSAEPQPWLAEDSILAVYAMFMQLNDSRASKEVRRARLRNVIPAEVYEWMYPDGTSWDAPLMGAARQALPIPGPDILSLRGVADYAAPSAERGRYPLRGSNNWAVSGALTPSGRAIVSNDMHLGLNTPNIYYRARLVVDGRDFRDVSGVTLPGAPFVIAGSNTQIAWGYTNSYGDYTDAVLLVPGSAEGSYKTPRGELRFEVRKELISVKGQEPVAYEVRETIWGPVLDDSEDEDGEMAVSWIAHNSDAVNLNLIKLETATSVQEALDIANTMGMPPQNFVTGDAGGNIGWTIAGKIPAKSGFDARLPADWSVEPGWLGWVPADEYPRIVNPESGRIWTANARVVDAQALAIVGDGGYDLGARATQIRDGLFDRETFTPDDMLAIQYDDRALFLTRWQELLLAVLSDERVAADSQLLEYRRLVAGWIPRAVPESVGYRLVRAFRLEVERRFFYALSAPAREVFGDDVSLRVSNQFEGPLWSTVTQQPEHLLPGEYANWDDFLFAAVQTNLSYFNENFDGPLSERSWGEVNTAAIRHPLSRSIPLVGDFLDMPQDLLGGDLDMPKAQGPAFGASERFSVSPGDEANSVLHMPTGQSGHPLSDFYAAGHQDWVDGLSSPFLPGTASHTLTLRPE
ncbi:MAG: penicillin acylase family protein [Gammaproteobacteria bacterium]|nr:penicillin acylase family protein [Gammaproteobacteria bacterium]